MSSRSWREWSSGFLTSRNTANTWVSSSQTTGDLLAGKGRYAEAMAAYRHSGDLFERLVAEQPARASYRQMRTEERDRLVRLLANCPDLRLRAPDEAVRLARQMVTDDPKEGVLWGALGLALYHHGDSKGAVEALETSLQHRPEDPTTGFALALARCHLGAKAQARALYDKSAAWMDQKKLGDDESRRYRAEAAARLGLKDASVVAKDAKSPR